MLLLIKIITFCTATVACKLQRFEEVRSVYEKHGSHGYDLYKISPDQRANDLRQISYDILVI